MEADPLEELARLITEAGFRLYVHAPFCDMWTKIRKCTQSCGKQLMEAKIELQGGKLPTKATEGSAGWDLYAAEGAVIAPKQILPVSVGFKIALPSDIEMQIRSRSGLSTKGIVVANSPGTVDSDYRGIVKVILRNDSDNPFQVSPGDRIAQAVFAWVPRINLTTVDNLDETARGTGGFGSTGK